MDYEPNAFRTFSGVAVHAKKILQIEEARLLHLFRATGPRGLGHPDRKILPQIHFPDGQFDTTVVHHSGNQKNMGVWAFYNLLPSL
jgi:hypothetical protein